MDDLKQWASDTAPTLTDVQWKQADDWDWAYWCPSAEHHTALLAYRDEIAASVDQDDNWPLSLRLEGHSNPFIDAVARKLEAKGG